MEGGLGKGARRRGATARCKQRMTPERLFDGVGEPVYPFGR